MMRPLATKLGTVGLVLFGLGIIAWAAKLPLREFYVNVLLGWLIFLGRVAERVSVNWSAVATGVVCLLLFWAGLHAFLRWLAASMRAHGGLSDSQPAVWKLRWTTALVGVVLLMFAAGISMIGVVHQTAWLAASPQPYVEERVRWYFSTSQDQLKDMGMSVGNYHDIRQTLPPHDPYRASKHSWMTAILPFSMLTVDGIDMDLDWDDPQNKPSFARVMPTYLNPEIAPFRNAEGYALSHYAGNVHVLGNDHVRSFSQVADGLSHTLLAGEAATNFKPWGDPTNLRDIRSGLNTHPNSFGGPSGNGAWLLAMDGSVKFCRKDTSPAILEALAHPSDGKK